MKQINGRRAYMGEPKGADARRLRSTKQTILWALLSALWMFACALPAKADQYGGFYYLNNNGVLTITGYGGPGGAVNIPASINGNPVVAIGEGAFSSRTNVTDVIMPNSVISAGWWAFYGCTSLTNVTLSTNLTEISTAMFSQCDSLRSITLPKSVVSIGNSAFQGCDGLANIVFTTNVQFISYYAFNGCASLESIVLPNSITSIMEGAFAACSNLTSATLPSGLKTIPSILFNNCPRLTTIGFPNAVTTIGAEAFYGCSSLVTVVIPDTVTNLGYHAFGQCGALSNVWGGNGLTYLPNSVFNSCQSLVNFSIPSNVVEVADYAFYNCTNLTAVSIPAHAYAIGPKAFAGCVNLRQFYVDSGNYSFGAVEGVLFDSSLTNLVIFPPGKGGDYSIPYGVTAIGASAFAENSQIASITFPATVAYIGSNAFANCSLLTALYFNGNAPSVMPDAFAGSSQATVYYKPGTSGWGATLATLATAKWSESGSAGMFTYAIVDGGAKITGYNGTGGSVSIPDQIDSYPVTGIESSAFMQKTNLLSVTIPGSVNTIGTYAFYGCNELTNVLLTNGLSSLGYGAFQYCCRLYGLYLPATVTNIGDAVFTGCYSLASISVDGGNPAYSSVAGALYDKSGTALLRCPQGVSGDFSISSNTTHISQGAFAGCQRLDNISIPASVATIGQEAFANCGSLNGLYFYGNAPSFGTNAFWGDWGATVYYQAGTSGWGAYCEGLPTVMLNAPAAASSFQVIISPDEAVQAGAKWRIDGGLWQLSGATVTGLAPGMHTLSFIALGGWGAPEDSSFYLNPNGGSISRVTFTPPGSVPFTYRATNGAVTITGYTGMKKTVEVPENIDGLPVESIGDYAFYNCTNVASISLPSTLTRIGRYCFGNCVSLTNLSLPNNLKSIGGFAFVYCVGLTNMVIPSAVTTLEYGVFYGCANLVSANIPEGITNLDRDVFYYCSQLRNISLPGGLASIGSNAFHGCESLESVTLPDSVTSIGDSAFLWCINLTNITIPKFMTQIGNGAFYACGKLSQIVIPDGVTSIGEATFAGCGELKNLYISTNVTSIGYQAFRSCYSLHELYLPRSLNYIDSEAFSYCGNMAMVRFEGNAPLHGNNLFLESPNVTVIYNLGTSGWGATYADRPTQYWGNSIAAGEYAIRVEKNQAVNIPLAKILKQCANPLSLPLVVSNAATHIWGSYVGLTGSMLYYTPPTNFVGRDTIHYLLVASNGESVWGDITVDVVDSDTTIGGQNMIAAKIDANGSLVLTFAGIPNVQYLVQASTTLATNSWINLGTFTAGANGKIEFVDTQISEYPSRFYRTVKP